MNTFKKIKAWYKLAKPHKGYLAGAFITSLLACAVPVIQAIPTAKVTTSLTNLDYSGAIFWLLLGLACTFLYYLLWHFNYVFYYKQSKYGNVYLNQKLFDKIAAASEEGLSKQSIEKIMLVATSNIDYVVKFTDYITYQSCYILQAFITAVIVCFYNLTIGLILFGIIVLMFFWNAWIQNRVQKITNNIFKERDTLGEEITDIVDSRTYTNQMNLHAHNKQKFLNQVKVVSDRYAHRGQYIVLRRDWTYGILYIIATALTIWLAVQTGSNELSLTTYLIIAPYLISLVDYCIAGYAMLYELQREDVSRLRLETVLNMPSKDLIAFGNNSTDKLTQSLIFSNISFKNVEKGANKTGSVSPCNLEFSPNTISLIQGVQNCGKRSLFYMLRRSITPTTGTITMDGININDFNKQTYNHNFSYATSKPYFYSESIFDNLSYVCSSKKKIVKVLKQLGIYETVKNLSNGLDTNVIKEADQFNAYLLFMLGLARAILSNSEWIAIYEFPTSLTAKQIAHVKDCLINLKKSCSFIIFSASDLAADICDNCYVMAAGHLRKLAKVEG